MTTQTPIAGNEIRAGVDWPDWDSPVLTMVGQIDSDCAAEELRKQLKALLNLHALYVVVDLTAVGSCGQMGLRVLRAAREETRRRGGWLSVYGSLALLDQLSGFSRQPSGGHGAHIAY